MQRTGGALQLDADERDLIRSLVMADPRLVLDDDQVMRALIRETGVPDRQVVDLRDRLVERLETRLGRLVEANRSMIAAAYENVAGTEALHRAVLALIEAEGLSAFLVCLTRDAPQMLGLAGARLCLEADVPDTRPADGLGAGLGGRVLAMPHGSVETYMGLGTLDDPGAAVLRPAGAEAEEIFGRDTPVRSEALVRLDIGGATGLVVFGSEDPERFGPDQGTDLLEFFGGVVGRLLTQRLRAIEAD